MKLLIVDDEVQIRQGIRDGIDWKELGFAEVMDAENGLKALEIFHSFLPEIVITDIRMPGMDGLELSKRIKEISASTKIIILSGYADFEYAKTALQTGVSEYELKPVKIKSLIQMVVRLKEMAEKEAALAQANHLVRVKQVMESILQGELNEPREIKRYFREYYQLQLKKDISCLIIEIDRNKADPSQLALNSEHYAELLQQLQRMARDLGGALIERSSMSFYMLIIDKEKLVLERRIQSYYQQINQALSQSCRCSISIGVSRTGDLKNIPQWVEEANQALKSKLGLGQSHLSYYKDIYEARQVNHLFAVRERELRDYISELNPEGAGTIIFDEFARIVEKKGTTVAQINSLCLDLLNILIRTLDNQVLELGPLVEEMNHFSGFEQYRDWIVKIYERVLNEAAELKAMRHNPGISKAIEYIKKHYQQDLSIERLAEYIAITPNYFSHLFKKETSIPFNEFLNKTRINEAKRLLKQSNLLAYEISERIGFQNYKYFIQVFKKLEGCSPTDYRKKL